MTIIVGIVSFWFLTSSQLPKGKKQTKNTCLFYESNFFLMTTLIADEIVLEKAYFIKYLCTSDSSVCHLCLLIIGKINIENFEYYKHFYFLNFILRLSCVSFIIPYFLSRIFLFLKSATYEKKMWKFYLGIK